MFEPHMGETLASTLTGRSIIIFFLWFREKKVIVVTSLQWGVACQYTPSQPFNLHEFYPFFKFSPIHCMQSNVDFNQSYMLY